MSFNHVIELLINLFVLLLSARREGESRLELRALAAFVLLLAQRLCQPGSPPPTAGEVDGGVERGVVGGGVATDGDEEDEATGRKEEDREQKEKRGKKR